VNHSDWIIAAGSGYAGRGARPLNPKLLQGVVTKGAPPAKTKSKKSNAYRRLILALAESSLRESRMLVASYRHKRDDRAGTTVPPLWRLARDPAAQLETCRVMTRWHGIR
jgi:hypothetical protein